MLLNFANWLTSTVLGLSLDSRFGAALSFFIYDSIKILFLLFCLIFLIGVLRTYLPQRKIKAWMNQKGLLSYFFAALFGIATPFCSCSSIPIFFGFLEAGIPLGVSFAFLITSPLINEYLFVLMTGLFGWQIAVIYVISGMLLGICAGWVLGKMNLEKYLVRDMAERAEAEETSFSVFSERLKFGWHEAVDITQNTWVWVLVGVAIGAGIHNYIPEEAIHNAISKAGLFSVPLAALLGVPLYASCASVVPVAIILFQKAIPLGTALAFLMGMSALSLPEAVMLRRAMHVKLILIFFGITTLGIIFTGYLFNVLQPLLAH